MTHHKLDIKPISEEVLYVNEQNLVDRSLFDLRSYKSEEQDDNNLIRSMSRKRCSPDNSACEGFYGRLKNEIYYKRDWKDVTLDELISIVNNYIKWYNETIIKNHWGIKVLLNTEKN